MSQGRRLKCKAVRVPYLGEGRSSYATLLYWLLPPLWTLLLLLLVLLREPPNSDESATEAKTSPLVRLGADKRVMP